MYTRSQTKQPRGYGKIAKRYVISLKFNDLQPPVDRLKSLIGRVQPPKTVNYSCKHKGMHLNQEEPK